MKAPVKLVKIYKANIRVHDATSFFIFRFITSSLLSRLFSIFMTRWRIEEAKSSPEVLKANMVMRIPRRHTGIVIPLPSSVLGVMIPYPEIKRMNNFCSTPHYFTFKIFTEVRRKSQENSGAKTKNKAKQKQKQSKIQTDKVPLTVRTYNKKEVDILIAQIDKR